LREERVDYAPPPEPDYFADASPMTSDCDIWAPDGSLIGQPAAPAGDVPVTQVAAPQTATAVGQKLESVATMETVVATAVQAAPEPLVSVPQVEAHTAPFAEPPPAPVKSSMSAAPKPPVRVATEEFQTSLTSLLTVVIRRCGNASQDVARLEAVHQTLLTFKGKQRFSICLRNAGKRDVTLDFPNDTTRDCPELRQKLAQLGADMR
jgi:hypothetical protein